MQEIGLLQNRVHWLIIGALYNLRYAMNIFDAYRWVGLGVIGILLSFASTRIEYWFKKVGEIKVCQAHCALELGKKR